MRAGSQQPAVSRARSRGDAPHIILFPEVAFNKRAFLKKVRECVKQHTSTASWSSAKAPAMPTASSWPKPVRVMRLATLSSVASHRWLPVWCAISLGYKYHYAVADYLQRSARHIASAVDVQQAYAVGKAAVDFALAGQRPRSCRSSSGSRTNPTAGESNRPRFGSHRQQRENAAGALYQQATALASRRPPDAIWRH